MLLFNASLINITQSMLRLERARLLESQSEHDECTTLKLNTVPYVKSYVDCAAPIDNSFDEIMIVIISAVVIVVLIIINIISVHYCRSRNATTHISDDSTEDTSSSASIRNAERI